MRDDESSAGRDENSEPLPEGFDPYAVDLADASEDLLWKVLPHIEGTRRAEALYVLGSRLARNERWEQAVVCAEESAQEWERADDSAGLVHGLLAAASCRSRLEDFSTAIDHYTRGIDLLRTYGPESELLDAHSNLGYVYAETGDHLAAIEQFEAALELAQRQDEVGALGYLYERMASCFQALGATDDRVRESLITARTQFAAAKDLAKVMDINDQLARFHDHSEDYNTAVIYLEENLHLAKSLGKSEAQGVAHYRYAGALRLCGRWDDAFEHIDRARQLLQDAADHERVLWCDLEKVWCLQRAGRIREATELLTTLWVTARILAGPAEVASVANDLYLDALSRGDDDDRMRIATQAITWARDNEQPELLLRFTIEAALCEADRRDWERMGSYLDALPLDAETDFDENSDALRQCAFAEYALNTGDPTSAAMSLAGIAVDDHLVPHVLARVLRTRGTINQALVRGSGISDLARAAQIWTTLGWRQQVSLTLEHLVEPSHGSADADE